MDREQIEKWMQQAKEAMDAEYTASGSAEIAAYVYDAKLIELAWQAGHAAALEEAKEACDALRRRCSLCEGQYLHDACDSIGYDLDHYDYLDAIAALAAKETK